jgi:hypothetical protein
MLDWFKKRDYSNVVKFPAPQATPYIEPPIPQEKEATVHYTIGHTDDNRIVFKIGYTTLTMTHQGVQMLIDQLELYRNQMHEEEE